MSKFLRISFRAIALGTAAALATIATASAQNGTITQQRESRISNPEGVVKNFDPDNIGPVLTELGLQWETRLDDSGNTFIVAAVTNEFVFNIFPNACLGPNNTGCVGASFLVLFTGTPPNPQSVSAFNQKYLFTSAGVYPDGSGAYISRYEIADYGIFRGNVVSSLGSFVFLANAFSQMISTTAKTVSLDGFADDLASSYLNQRGLADFGVTDDRPKTAADLHRAGFEETPKTILELLNSDVAGINKISNNISE